jgi:Domain of unknown function (DUF5666)
MQTSRHPNSNRLSDAAPDGSRGHCQLAVTAWAQWLKQLGAGTPRLAGGTPNLSAPAPRRPDGHPDPSGIWVAKGVAPINPLRNSGEMQRIGLSSEHRERSREIIITVSLNGNAARVESEQQEHDDNDEHANEVKGVVSNLSGSCVTLTFTVQSTTVKTNGATKFEDGPCTRIANGTRVEVEGTRQADGTILATEVELND